MSNILTKYLIENEKNKKNIIKDIMKEKEGVLLFTPDILKLYEELESEILNKTFKEFMKLKEEGKKPKYEDIYNKNLFNTIKIDLKKFNNIGEREKRELINTYIVRYIRDKIKSKIIRNKDQRYYKGTYIEDNKYHSIDKINIHSRLNIEYINPIIESLLNDNNELFKVNYYKSSKVNSYRYNYDIKTYEEIYDEEGYIIGKEERGTIKLMYELINDTGKEMKSLKVEFNPNKVAFNNPIFEYIRLLLLINEKATHIKRFDYAVDFTNININNILLRTYRKHNTGSVNNYDIDINEYITDKGKTYYIGKRPNEIKIYQKLYEIERGKQEMYYRGFIEDKDRENWTRIEESIECNESFTFENIKKEAPFINDIPYYKQNIRIFDIVKEDKLKVLKSVDFVENNKGELIKVKASDKATIYAISNNYISLNDLNRREKEKIITILNYLDFITKEEDKKNINIDTGKAFILIQTIVFDLFN